LDDLEQLVVMHLFKLSKLSLSGTGYKLHQQIGKVLQQCSEAIQNALSQYNVQAAALDPPHPAVFDFMLSYSDTTEHSFLGEFDLLHHSCTDIRELDWTKPAHREATVKYFKLCCAHEEITWLNVEVCRLRTAIHDEAAQMTTVITELLVFDPPLVHELQWQWKAHEAVNAVHTFWLDQITLQPGFSGSRGIGQRVGAITAALEPTNTISHSTAEGDGMFFCFEIYTSTKLLPQQKLVPPQSLPMRVPWSMRSSCRLHRTSLIFSHRLLINGRPCLNLMH
ncbi:hypothetical protein EDB19DRAFT_1638357, partial [Suillus lakei]